MGRSSYKYDRATLEKRISFLGRVNDNETRECIK